MRGKGGREGEGGGGRKDLGVKGVNGWEERGGFASKRKKDGMGDLRAWTGAMGSMRSEPRVFAQRAKRSILGKNLSSHGFVGLRKVSVSESALGVDDFASFVPRVGKLICL